MSLSDGDRELVKKHGFVDETYLMTKPVQTRLNINFTENNLATFLAERDALAIKEKDDAVREALEKAADLCDDMVLYTGLDCANAIRALIEPKD